MKYLKYLKYDFYVHKSGGVLFDHFGGIGQPRRVSVASWIFYRVFGFRGTYAKKGSSIRRVMIRAAIIRGYGRHSYAMDKIRACDARGNYEW